MEETPVYLFTGFMDSGKTTLIQETLFDQEFGNGAKTLIIACEDGEVEYDEDKLKKINAKLLQIENEEDFSLDMIDHFTKINKENVIDKDKNYE